MNRESKVFVAGHRGMVGAAIVRHLKSEGFQNIVVRTSAELDLRVGAEVSNFLSSSKPEYVFVAAARVGGIMANKTRPAEFIYDNLAIQTNLIHHSYLNGVKKLLFLGSSCIFPKFCPQPIKEEYLLTGSLEPTNEPYAVAKIAGLKLCEAYRTQYGFDSISLMPTNLYGPGDNFNPSSSHVLPALLLKAHEAKERGDSEMVVWGSGTPMREFLYCDDLAEACLFLMRNYSSPEPINVGTGQDCSIRELAETILDVVGFRGTLIFDSTKPDGTPRKLLDVSRLDSLGWKAKTRLREGIKRTYEIFKSEKA